MLTNTKNTPVEALERSFPMKVRRLALRRGSGGLGVHRGGDGIEHDLEVLEDVTVSLITERPTRAPSALKAGDVLRVRTPGGGGYGVAD